MSYPYYLLPFYLTATVCDKIKEMSVPRDRDYHETITESPLSNRSEPRHVSLSMNTNTIYRASRNGFRKPTLKPQWMVVNSKGSLRRMRLNKIHIENFKSLLYNVVILVVSPLTGGKTCSHGVSFMFSGWTAEIIV